MIKKLIFLFCTSIFLLSACKEDDIDKLPAGGVVADNPVKVGISFAEINGKYDSEQYNLDDYYVGIMYSGEPDFEWASFQPAEDFNHNGFKVTLTWLSPDQEYYYCACVISEDSIVSRGEVKSFRTKSFEYAAEVAEAQNMYLSEANIGYSFPEKNLPTEPADRENLKIYLLFNADSSMVKDFNESEKIYDFEYFDGEQIHSHKMYNLLSGETYYCVACTQIGEYVHYSNVYEFTTPSMLDYMKVDTTDISYETADITFCSHLEDVYPDRSREYTLSYSESADMSQSQEVCLYVYNTDSATFHLEPLKPGTTYYYQFHLCTVKDHMAVSIDSKVLSFTTKAYPKPATSGFVDLGLTSGTLWAACNMGAASPSERGTLYAWGEVAPKEIYEEDNYLHITKAEGGWPISYNKIGEEISGTQYDVAFLQNDGSRMPSRTQTEELLKECYLKRMSVNGVYGSLLIGKNEQAIFVPAGPNIYTSVASFWTGTAKGNFDAYCIWNESVYGRSRYEGCPVRPVKQN